MKTTVVLPSKLKQWMLAVALMASFATYSSGEDKIAFYVVAIVAMILCSVGVGLSFKGRSMLLLLVAAYLLLSIITVLANAVSFQSFPLQSLAYPAVFGIIAASLWRSAYQIGGVPALIVLLLFLMNGTVALVTSVFGMSELPLIGAVELGRTIFFSSMPSSSGLIWNVNYYAATQAVGFWLLYSMLQRGLLPRWTWWLIAAVGCSVILGSSRSSTVAMIGSIGLYRFFVGGRAERLFIVSAAVAIGLSFSALYLWAANDPAINATLRLYKGLNARDELWAVGLELASKAPLLGYGSPTMVQNEMLLAGAVTSTTQSSLLSMQLLFGIGGPLLFFLLVALATNRFLLQRHKARADVALFCLMAFCFVDSFVRSYLVGGIGVIPFVFICTAVYFIGLSATTRPERARAILLRR